MTLGTGILGGVLGGVGSDLWVKHTPHNRGVFLFMTATSMILLTVPYRLVPGSTGWFWALQGLNSVAEVTRAAHSLASLPAASLVAAAPLRLPPVKGLPAAHFALD